MKNKKILITIICGIIVVLAITLPGIKHELSLKLGATYNLKIEGYDPYDPLRGKYIQFTMDTSTISPSFTDQNVDGKICYITLKTDTQGFYTMDKAYLEKPSKNTPYLISTIHTDYDGNYYYDSPFEKYFISENISQYAENILFQNSEKAYISINFWNGNSTVSGMYIDNKRIEELSKDEHEKST